MNDLRRIGRGIILEGFPELLGTRIDYEYAQLKNPLKPSRVRIFANYPERRNWYIVQANTFMKRAPRDVIVGGLAHEFGHMVRDYRNLMLCLLRRGTTKLPFLKYQEELGADLEAAERGYSDELSAVDDFLRERHYMRPYLERTRSVTSSLSRLR